MPSFSAEDEYFVEQQTPDERWLVALENMPELQRDVLLARVFEKASVSECARRFKMPRSTMYRFIARAKRELIEKANSLYVVGEG